MILPGNSSGSRIALIMTEVYVVVRTRTSVNTRPALYIPPASKSRISVRQVMDDDNKIFHATSHLNVEGEQLLFVASIDKSANGRFNIMHCLRKHLENAQ